VDHLPSLQGFGWTEARVINALLFYVGACAYVVLAEPRNLFPAVGTIVMLALLTLSAVMEHERASHGWR
jgi:hypothetical protein